MVITINNKIKVILCNSIIHIDIGKRRCAGDEDKYEKHLRAFVRDREYDSIVSALNDGNYIAAGHFSQRLRNKSYNLGMVRLAKYCDVMCLAMQTGGNAPDYAQAMRDVTMVYGTMKDCINRAFSLEEDNSVKERS